MRDILFRGKLIDNGEWVEGFYTVIQNPFTENGKPFRHLICNGTNIFNYDVIPETVGQYTGLTDKNGKKIFEGDIIKHTQKYEISGVVTSIGVVKWSDSYGGWIISSFTNGRADMFLANEKNRVEVIGNIHDNPELIKGGE